MRRAALFGLAGLLLAAAAAAAWEVWRTFPKDGGRVRVAGHAAAITIETDPRGVPTVRASSIPDAMFGLGYVHARDRLWQMEFQRRVGSGRLAEVLGGGLVPADRFLRTIGFRRAAEEAWNALSPSARRFVEAYAAGVNGYLAADPARPIEFRLLGVRPEPWAPVDSLVWAKMMAWDLAGNAREEIRRSRFIEAVGTEKAAELLPLAGSRPTILGDGPWRPSTASTPVSRLLPPAAWLRLGDAFESLATLGLGVGEDLGSNSWVIGGSRTASGRPILANDPHLGLKTPSVWYLASIDAPGYRAQGATLPGLPGVVIGRNDRIAWGLTSVEPDVQDLFVEDVDPADPSRYRHRGEWKRFETRAETIRVRGAKDVPLTVRTSEHGPIVTDLFDGAAKLGPAVALRWAGLDAGDRSAEALFAIASARNWNEFLEGVRLFRAPPQNFVYADVEGHIGYAAGGAMPIRPHADGLLPVSGAGADDWAGMVPFEALPRALDPPRGYIVTANNRLTPAEPYPFGLTWAEPWRAARIAERIESQTRITPDEVAAIQLDRLSLQARELLPLLLDTAPSDAASKDALARLASWNGEMGPDSIPAAVYAAWFVELARMPEDELGEVPRGRTRGRFLIEALRADSSWCDDVRTPKAESCADFRASTLKDAVARLSGRFGADPSGWRWERLHRAVFPHGVFHGVRFLRRVFDLEVGQGGDGATPNVGSFAQDGSFEMDDGPSYRQIVDFADPAHSRYVHTTGQSGNVFARRYRDLLPLWRAGTYFEMGGAPSQVLVLEPLPR